MAFSKSWGYAVRALVHLAAQDDQEKRWQSGELAEATGLPSSYLSKVLSALTSAGLLDSARGRGGGVRLAVPAASIRLSDIAAATDDLPGIDPAGDSFNDAPPALRKAIGQRWQPYQRGLLEFLAANRLVDLIDA